jgi:hypothetical protein
LEDNDIRDYIAQNRDVLNSILDAYHDMTDDETEREVIAGLKKLI